MSVHSLSVQDARQNNEILAKKLNLSAATVRRKLRKLINSGLLKVIGVVDPTKFGFPLTVVIGLDVSHNKLESSMEALAQRPEITSVATTTGRFDIIAYGYFRSTAYLSEFMSKVLAELEGDSHKTLSEKPHKAQKHPKQPPSQQIPFFGPKPPVSEELEKLEIDSLTPLEALTKLYELQKKAREG